MTIAPTKERVAPEPTEVLIEEARRRGRRHRLTGGIVTLILAGSLITAVTVSLPRSNVPRRSGPVHSQTPRGAVASCLIPDLRASFDGIDSGLAGSGLIGFQLANVGPTSCAVQGHPSAIFRRSSGVVVTDITVGQMGAIVHDRTVTSSPRIVLRPRGSAYFDMIVPVCTGHSSGALASVQLTLRGGVVPGIISVGRQPNQPFWIGDVCVAGDPGTYVSVSQLEPIRDLT